MLCPEPLEGSPVGTGRGLWVGVAKWGDEALVGVRLGAEVRLGEVALVRLVVRLIMRLVVMVVRLVAGVVLRVYSGGRVPWVREGVYG